MAIVSGDRINFVYITGSELPSIVDDSTVYILAESHEMYVGSTLISNKGAQYSEVTQAEYDALPATKYSDGIIYFVLDYQGSNVYGKIVLNGTTYATSGGGESYIYSDTTAGWASQATLVAQANNIYVYTDYQSASGQNIPGIKIGDGNAYLIDLPFIDTIYAQHIADSEIHVSSTDRTNWDNKVTCYIDPNDNTKLIFSN